MTGYKDFFVQAAFYCTPIYARVLIHPIQASVEPAQHRSWAEVNDELMRSVPSATLLHLVTVQLMREMGDIALENINGWVLHASRATLAREALVKASERFVTIRDGVFKTELTAAVQTLLVRRPQYRAFLSGKDTVNEAASEIVSRALAACRFHWEIGLYANTDARALSVRALSLLQSTLAERIASPSQERSIMMPARFKFYRRLSDRIGQFLGLDVRLDASIEALVSAVALFPRDGRALYGSTLNQFWSICEDLLDSLNDHLQNDFGPEIEYFEELDEASDLFENDTIDTLVVLDQIDTDNGIEFSRAMAARLGTKKRETSLVFPARLGSAERVINSEK